MNSRILTLALLAALVAALILLGERATVFRLPGIQTNYEPDQPVKFSHRLHAGEMNISCTYCHYGASRSRHAGIPATSVCMNCHRFVTAPWGAVLAENKAADKEGRPPESLVSPELKKVYAAFGLAAPNQPDSALSRESIVWSKVHNLPDFVWFDHRPHVAAGVLCQTCHGPVETMERVRQTNRLNMGWCVNCHRQANVEGVLGKTVNAPTDCSACHF
ncbi:MAG: hypothetical protein FJY67_05910 [Calditrichaeota bacterium]|nr:hypothetical protein [Calditrichota bacterium]